MVPAPENKIKKENLPNFEDDPFRLRSYVGLLAKAGHLDTIEQAVALADLTSTLDGNLKAVLFSKVGPEKTEIIGNVMASRSRLALAFQTEEKDLLSEILHRINIKQPTHIVCRSAASVQEIVWQGQDADFTRLPVPFQHGKDGGPYLSSTLEFTINPETGQTNVGCRRMMLRGRREAGVDFNAPSDLRAI